MIPSTKEVVKDWCFPSNLKSLCIKETTLNKLQDKWQTFSFPSSYFFPFFPSFCFLFSLFFLSSFVSTSFSSSPLPFLSFSPSVMLQTFAWYVNDKGLTVTYEHKLHMTQKRHDPKGKWTLLKRGIFNGPYT